MTTKALTDRQANRLIDIVTPKGVSPTTNIIVLIHKQKIKISYLSGATIAGITARQFRAYIKKTRSLHYYMTDQSIAAYLRNPDNSAFWIRLNGVTSAPAEMLPLTLSK